MEEEAEECVGFLKKDLEDREDTQSELTARVAADALEFGTASEKPTLLSLT